MNYDIIFIGGGPATLSAIQTIAHLKLEQKILVIEAGRKNNRRACPGIKKQKCTSCYENKCHVVNGLGGSSGFLGNKLCRFPASSTSAKIIAGDYARQLEGQAYATFTNDTSADFTNEKHNHYLAFPNRKEYQADIVFSNYYKSKIARLTDTLEDYADLKIEVSVTDISQSQSGAFTVVCSDGDEITTSQLVLATGRSGFKDTEIWLKKIGVEFEKNEIEVGFRLEVDTADISDDFFYQNDPKYKFDFDKLGSGRTFCGCKDGQIVPVKFGDSYFADGAFGSSNSGKTNIAFMARTNTELSNFQLENWIQTINKKSNGSLLVAEIESLSSDPNLNANLILDAFESWPSSNYQTILTELISRIVTGRLINLTTPHSKIKVFGPSIDNYWCKPKLVDGISTEINNLHIIGDANGVSRGIVQAATTGYAFAQKISQSKIDNNILLQAI